MYKVYDSDSLAKILDDVALGNTYSADALLAAKRHPVSTHNDRCMADRWLWGNQTASDALNLQQLAIYIRESKLDVKVGI